MRVENRIKICQLLLKIDQNKTYSEKLGISDESTYHGEKCDHKDQQNNKENQ